VVVEISLSLLSLASFSSLKHQRLFLFEMLADVLAPAAHAEKERFVVGSTSRPSCVVTRSFALDQQNGGEASRTGTILRRNQLLNFDRATASKRKGLERDLEKNEEDPKQLHFFRSGAKKREGHQKLASARERVAFEKFQRQQNSEAAARAAAGSAFSNPSTYPAVRGGRLDGPLDSHDMATSERWTLGNGGEKQLKLHVSNCFMH